MFRIALKSKKFMEERALFRNIEKDGRHFFSSNLICIVCRLDIEREESSCFEVEHQRTFI